ncbi:inositol monophosphatase family protein [Arthrobacter sp. NPDC090010]|uniref:inositol monophosphatase family protein n=1 Tax=Arthrobacter sp. NPDC090010 TaxID=3363942 RepID=UPI00382E50D6
MSTAPQQPHDLDPALDDAALAEALVQEAGNLARNIRQGGLNAERKTGVADVVTQADRAAERYIVEQLARCRPQDGILGEEGSARPSSSGRSWIIDPVDGTYNFLRGSSYWCSAIALVQDSESGRRPLLGAVHQPEEGKSWVGGAEVPSRLNGSPLARVQDKPLAESSAATYIHPTWLQEPLCAMPWHAAAVGAASLRMLGSGSCDLARVAEGELDCWFQHSCPDWDWYPGAALVLAAGGVAEVFTINGLRWHLAGSATAVAQLRAAMETARVS